MTQNTFAENPYSSPADIVRAELAEPRRPAKKRHVGLAIAFLLLDLPLLCLLSWLACWAFRTCFEEPPRPFAVPATIIFTIADAPLILVAILCAKEFVQALRGR